MLVTPADTDTPSLPLLLSPYASVLPPSRLPPQVLVVYSGTSFMSTWHQFLVEPGRGPWKLESEWKKLDSAPLAFNLVESSRVYLALTISR
jgi:hypothetical protein